MIRDGAPPARETATSVYVYAVAREASPGELVGVRETPVRVVEAAGLAAVIGDVPEHWRSAGRADLEAHDRVLSELIGGTTVVPMRFGIVMASDAEVCERLLERHASQLSELLDRLDGRVQMSVKAYYVDEAPLRQVLERHPELKRRSDELEGLPVAATQQERIALGRDVAGAVEEQRELDERALVEPLAAVADELRIDPIKSERQAVSVQLLVDTERRAELGAVVDELTRDHAGRFAFRYVGPLPPYSFSDLVLDGEGSWD